jgi:hypothetical protein
MNGPSLEWFSQFSHHEVKRNPHVTLLRRYRREIDVAGGSRAQRLWIPGSALLAPRRNDERQIAMASRSTRTKFSVPLAL